MFLKLAYLHSQISARQLSADSSSTKTLYCLSSVSPQMNTIASRDQFMPIRIGENLVVNYHTLKSRSKNVISYKSTSPAELYLSSLHRRFENAKKRPSFCQQGHTVAL